MDSNNKKILGEDNENKEQFHSEKYKKKSDCPNFLLKLYQILEKDEYKDIIEWGEDGTHFIVIIGKKIIFIIIYILINWN